MARRGSTVRVRQRALQKPRKQGLLVSDPLEQSPACGGYGAVMEPSGPERPFARRAGRAGERFRCRPNAPSQVHSGGQDLNRHYEPRRGRRPYWRLHDRHVPRKSQLHPSRAAPTSPIPVPPKRSRAWSVRLHRKNLTLLCHDGTSPIDNEIEESTTTRSARMTTSLTQRASPVRAPRGPDRVLRNPR
jgi:hypothetical protein